MGELVFVGLGLHSEMGMSLLGLAEIRNADNIFVELHTNPMPGLSIKNLEEISANRIHVVSRSALEEENGEVVLKAAQISKAVLLVPGDPLIATTHIDLRIRAEKSGIMTRIVHGASIISAAIALSSLQNYKFGRSVTVPFSERGFASETPRQVIRENKKMGLHTLCFLDVKVEEMKYMTVKRGLQALLTAGERTESEVVTPDTLAIGIARAGSKNPVVKAGSVKELMDFDFRKPPHTIIFPGKLHFMETEALITLAGASESLRKPSSTTCAQSVANEACAEGH